MSVRGTYALEIIDGAEINAVINDKEFFGKGSMYAHVRLEKGGSVKWHIHTNEIEYYYILSGIGIFTNSDKTEQKIKAGDVCTMQPNGGHAIAQIGDAPLEFMALTIYTV